MTGHYQTHTHILSLVHSLTHTHTHTHTQTQTHDFLLHAGQRWGVAFVDVQGKV